MLIGVIADDFTGASDIANTLAKGTPEEGGLETAQFPGVPTHSAPASLEAGVISLKSRSAPVEEAVSESLAALEWLLAQGCQQIVCKYCSTFDSTPEGNIGPVGEALAAALEAKGVVVCPAFPTAGRTVYQGHLFVFDRLLNESGMENHPLTPMSDADLRRWLGLQCQHPVGHVPHQVVAQGGDAVFNALKRQSKDGKALCVVDAVSDEDLITIGEALVDAKLVTGGSGIALGLPRNLIRQGLAPGGKPSSRAVSGPEAILAGSCSGATRGQIDLHRKDHPVLEIEVPRVMEGTFTSDSLVDFMTEHVGRAPLAYSSGSPEEVRRLQERFGREEVSRQLDELFAVTAQKLVERGWRRIVVAGGETSGAVAQALARSSGAEAMHIGPEIDPGVPVLTLGDPAIGLALKSGNFGAEDFFSKALSRMEAS